jgi:tRNA(adenine34) deaminase
LKSSALPVYGDEYFMHHALQQAQLAYEADEVPIGAVVVQQNKIIGRGHNQVERLNDATAHAEIIALTAAFNYIGAKYLPQATLYVTVEPCHMCAGALYWSKIGRVVYGTNDPKHGYTAFYKSQNPFHPKTELLSGILKEECLSLMQSFFREKRKF